MLTMLSWLALKQTKGNKNFNKKATQACQVLEYVISYEENI